MTAEPDLQALHDAAVRFARTGADIARSLFGRVRVSRKGDDSPVTEADHAAQEAILVEVAAAFPDHAILVEEQVPHPQRHANIRETDYCWVIDPIDGTRNFACGFPIYATSVAVLHRGTPVACGLFDATTDKMYSAIRSGGAFFDGERLSIPDKPLQDDTTVMVSSIHRGEIPDHVLKWMNAYHFRNQGSVSLHLAWVAAGLADAAVSLECKLWDIAASALVIEEAGGKVTSLDGNRLWPVDLTVYSEDDVPVIAGSPTMHGVLLKSLPASDRHEG